MLGAHPFVEPSRAMRSTSPSGILYREADRLERGGHAVGDVGLEKVASSEQITMSASLIQ